MLRFSGAPPNHVVPLPVGSSWWTTDDVGATGSVFGVQANNAFSIWVSPTGNTLEALCINPSP